MSHPKKIMVAGLSGSIAIVVVLLAVLPACTGQRGEATDRADLTKAGAEEEPSARATRSAAEGTEARPGDRPAGLKGGYDSIDALIGAFLGALHARDMRGIGELMVTRDEYRDLLFPHFQAGKEGDPVEFHWTLLSTKSVSGVRAAVKEHGGRELELLGVRFKSETRDYGPFRLTGRPRLQVRQVSTGETGELRVLGSIVELEGQYKFLSFND